MILTSPGWLAAKYPNIQSLLLIAGVSLISLGFVVWVIKPTGDLFLTFMAYGVVGVGCILLSMASGTWGDSRLTAAAVCVVAVGTVGLLYGLVRGNPGAASEGIFFVALPIVWLLFMISFTPKAVRVIVNLLPLLALVISILGISYWLHAIGVPGFGWSTLVPLGQAGGSGNEFVFGYSLKFSPISSLVNLLPFLFTSLVVPNVFSWKITTYLVWPAMASSLFFTFISGRKVLFLSTAIAVLLGAIILFHGTRLRQLRARFLVRAGIVAALGAVSILVTRFSPAAFFSSVVSDVFSPGSIRSNSAEALTNSWLASPIFGNGLGVVTLGAIRDPARPWNNELQYHLILNSLGLLGGATLLAATVLLLFLGSQIFRQFPFEHAYMAPLLTGSLGVLVANATNPYLHTPAHYWMLLLLAVATNAALRPSTSPLARATAIS